MISFDTENNNDILTLCCFYGRKQKVFDYKNFKNQDSMRTSIINFIASNPDMYVSHNLEYDLVNIFYPDYMSYLDLFYKGRLLFADLQKKRIRFKDSFNFSFSSLKNVGKNIGLEKMETDDFYNVAYCMRDAEIVYKYMDQFQDKISQDYRLAIKNTLAGTAQNIYLKRYDSFDIGAKNFNPDLLRWYYGGRTEMFIKGQIDYPIYLIDINSSYPSAMLEYLPHSECYESIEPETIMYLSEIEIELSDMDFPILPYRDERLLFPVGKFRTCATSVELNYLKESYSSHIKSLRYIKTYNFKDRDFVFSAFINHFYEKREQAKIQSNSFDSSFYKLVMNSVYGRFAVNGGIDKVNDGETTVLEIDSVKSINFSIPIFITAYARIALYRMIEKVKEIGGTLIYTDTDSVMFTFFDHKDHEKKIKETFEIDNKLGHYSLEKFSSGYFHNLKMYILGDDEKITCKGISGTENKKEFITTGKTTVKKPVKYRQSVKSVQGLKANFWEQFDKKDNNKFMKRVLHKSNSSYQTTSAIKL